MYLIVLVGLKPNSRVQKAYDWPIITRVWLSPKNGPCFHSRKSSFPFFRGHFMLSLVEHKGERISFVPLSDFNWTSNYSRHSFGHLWMFEQLFLPFRHELEFSKEFILLSFSSPIWRAICCLFPTCIQKLYAYKMCRARVPTVRRILENIGIFAPSQLFSRLIDF